jgi:hypothetical protein
MEKNIMLQRILTFAQLERKSLIRFAAPALLALSFGSSFAPVFAQEAGQRTFPSTEDAAHAFFIGPAAKEILSSGDPNEDGDARIRFVVRYEQMHRFVTEPNGAVALVVGAENWPFPIPLVNKNGSWYFDTPAGKDEILFRRIGKNETSAVDACRELVQAERQYFQSSPAGFPDQFAQKLVSDEGRHNGLYWHGAYDEYNSPINPLIANADGEALKDQTNMSPVPFNGYFFRVLTKQGPHAPGGAKNYVVDGRMSRGFAFVAYPAEYRGSGVMTFIVDESGTVYEKDLGPDTTKYADAMNAYDPDSTWHPAE